MNAGNSMADGMLWSGSGSEVERNEFFMTSDRDCSFLGGKGGIGYPLRSELEGIRHNG